MPSNKSKPKPKLNFEAIGTHWEIEVPSESTPRQLTHLQRRVVERIEEYDLDYSRFRPDSLVTLMAKSAGTYDLPPDAQPLFDLYREMYELTDGAVTPLIGQVLSDAGYDANYSLQAGGMHPTPAWDEVLVYTFPQLTLKTPALLDLGAAGKGYLVDIVAGILREEGIENYFVDAGGDMAYRGAEPLRVGLEHPTNLKQAVGVAELESGRSCAGRPATAAPGPASITSSTRAPSPRRLISWPSGPKPKPPSWPTPSPRRYTSPRPRS
jgi:thiamine biosynthesis lipoprotein